MLERINRDELLLNIAELIALRGTCGRLSVGAVLALESRIISSGYNGAPSGLPHCSPHICDIDSGCTRTVHAEANAIAFAAKNGVPTEGATMYCTHSPCNDCAKLMINAGIKRVVYRHQYRDDSPIRLLNEANVKTLWWNK